jgi:hypothetical protein
VLLHNRLEEYWPSQMYYVSCCIASDTGTLCPCTWDGVTDGCRLGWCERAPLRAHHIYAGLESSSPEAKGCADPWLVHTLPPKNNTHALGQLHMQDGQPVYGRLVQKFGA